MFVAEISANDCVCGHVCCWDKKVLKLSQTYVKLAMLWFGVCDCSTLGVVADVLMVSVLISMTLPTKSPVIVADVAEMPLVKLCSIDHVFACDKSVEMVFQTNAIVAMSVESCAVFCGNVFAWVSPSNAFTPDHV